MILVNCFLCLKIKYVECIGTYLYILNCIVECIVKCESFIGPCLTVKCVFQVVFFQSTLKYAVANDGDMHENRNFNKADVAFSFIYGLRFRMYGR